MDELVKGLVWVGSRQERLIASSSHLVCCTIMEAEIMANAS
jgi:hypothetical protein